MSSEVALTPKAGSIVTRMSMDQLKARLASTRDETGASLNQFLTFSGKTGKFFVKIDGEKVDVPVGTELAFNILDAKKGWTCWKEGKPFDDKDVGFFDALPPESAMPDHGPYKPAEPGQAQRDGWNNYIALPFKNLKTGQQYILKLSSESGRRSVGKLIDDVMQASAQGYDFTKDVPVVKLGVKEFEAKGFENSKPTFEIVKWLKDAISTAAIADGGASADAAAGAQQQAEMPAKKGILSSMLPNSKK
jgi:hypothetical protein